MLWSTGLEDHELPWLGSQPIVVPYAPEHSVAKWNMTKMNKWHTSSNIWKLLCFNDHVLRQMNSEGLLHSQLVMMAGIFRVRLKSTCIALWDPGQCSNRRQNWLLSWQVFQCNSKSTELISLFHLIFAYFTWCLNCMHLL